LRKPFSGLDGKAQKKTLDVSFQNQLNKKISTSPDKNMTKKIKYKIDMVR